MRTYIFCTVWWCLYSVVAIAGAKSPRTFAWRDLPLEIRAKIVARTACEAGAEVPDLCTLSQELRTEMMARLQQPETLARVMPSLLANHPGWKPYMIQHFEKHPEVLPAILAVHHDRWRAAAVEAGKQGKEPQHLFEMVSTEDLRWHLFLQAKEQQLSTPLAWKRHAATVLLTYAVAAYVATDAALNTAANAARSIAEGAVRSAAERSEVANAAAKSALDTALAADRVAFEAAMAVDGVSWSANKALSVALHAVVSADAAAEQAFAAEESADAVALHAARSVARSADAEALSARSAALSAFAAALSAPYCMDAVTKSAALEAISHALSLNTVALAAVSQALSLHSAAAHATLHLAFNTAWADAQSAGASTAWFVAADCLAHGAALSVAPEVFRSVCADDAVWGTVHGAVGQAAWVQARTLQHDCPRTLGRMAYRVAETEAWRVLMDPKMQALENIYAAVEAKLAEEPHDSLDHWFGSRAALEAQIERYLVDHDKLTGNRHARRVLQPCIARLQSMELQAAPPSPLRRLLATWVRTLKFW